MTTTLHSIQSGTELDIINDICATRSCGSSGVDQRKTCYSPCSRRFALPSRVLQFTSRSLPAAGETAPRAAAAEVRESAGLTVGHHDPMAVARQSGRLSVGFPCSNERSTSAIGSYHLAHRLTT
jgi:hypothetical protein